MEYFIGLVMILTVLDVQNKALYLHRGKEYIVSRGCMIVDIILGSAFVAWGLFLLF